MSQLEAIVILKQGDALSSFLFNLPFENVIRDATERCRMELDGNLTLFTYADDITLSNIQLEVIQTTIKNLIWSSKETGLIVNVTKTKYMATSRNLTIYDRICRRFQTFKGKY